jgi:nitrogen regulatory protein PII
MFMIMFVLHDVDRFEEVLQGWEEAGVFGVTILPSTGLGRIRQNALREDLPLIPSISDLLDHTEQLNRTIFSIVDDEQTIERVVENTQRIIGPLDQPNTGILAVIPLARVYGLAKHH